MFAEVEYDIIENVSNMEKKIIRYDGKRFITESEIDNEFTGKWVLIRTTGEPNMHEGFLVASADGDNELRPILSDIAIMELDCKAKIIYGCETRGDTLHVQLLG